MDKITALIAHQTRRFAVPQSHEVNAEARRRELRLAAQARFDASPVWARGLRTFA